MEGTRKFKKRGIPYEEIARVKFQNLETKKRYRVNLVEPVSQEDLEKLGTSILEAEYTIADDGTETIGGLKEYRLEDAPPAFQGLVADYRRRIIRELQHFDGLEHILDDLKKAGIVEELPTDSLPDGIRGMAFQPRDEREWKLWDKNSNEVMPWGETLRDREGDEFELVGGTPPHKPASAGFIRVIDDNGVKRELYPHCFDLEWRRTASS